MVAFSERMAETDRTVKKFLYGAHVRALASQPLALQGAPGREDLFGLLFAEPNCLPPPWRERAEAAERSARARIVADYIAGMTDRYALRRAPAAVLMTPSPEFSRRPARSEP